METDDLVVVGAGAAGLAVAIFAAREAPHLTIRCLDGARHLGAKILVSGGSRCNVTNRHVADADFWGGSSRVVRGALRAFSAARAVDFFASIGVALHEEADGKLFPDTQRSRTVLEALLGEARRRGVRLEPGERVSDVQPTDGGFEIRASRDFRARALVLATGGRSLPKTGSDGFGYELARRLGHTCVETTPALAPLLVDDPLVRALQGVAHPAAATLWVGGSVRIRLRGAWLWTHFGASGPLALDLSRHWHRAVLDGDDVHVTLSLLPGETFDSMETWWSTQTRARPTALVATALATRLPAAVVDAMLGRRAIEPRTTLAHLSRDERRRVTHLLLELPLRVSGSRGYGYAEVTAGGIPLDEIDPATFESRVQRGLYFAGEVLDVDGRLGGFNFQWAWSSGWVAGTAAARALVGESGSRV